MCGADRELIVDTVDYPEDINAVQLTEVERADLDTAIELERANTRFYLATAQRDDDPTLANAYKRLAAVEADIARSSASSPSSRTPPTYSHRARNWARGTPTSTSPRAASIGRGTCTRNSPVATSPRLREVWTAVSAIEADHIELDTLAKLASRFGERRERLVPSGGAGLRRATGSYGR